MLSTTVTGQAQGQSLPNPECLVQELCVQSSSSFSALTSSLQIDGGPVPEYHSPWACFGPPWNLSPASLGFSECICCIYWPLSFFCQSPCPYSGTDSNLAIGFGPQGHTSFCRRATLVLTPCSDSAPSSGWLSQHLTPGPCSVRWKEKQHFGDHLTRIYVSIWVCDLGRVFFFFQHLNWNIIALQWCISSCCISK